MSKRMTETQIVSILKEAEAGISAKELYNTPRKLDQKIVANKIE